MILPLTAIWGGIADACRPAGIAKVYDGTLDYDTAIINTLSPNSTIEFCCSFYTTKSTGIQYLYDTRDSSNKNGFTVLINEGVVFLIQNGNSSLLRNEFVTNNQAISGAGYYFVQLTQTGTTNIRMWVNGVEFTVTQIMSTPSVVDGTGIVLGGSPASSNRFSGLIRKMQFLDTLQSDFVRRGAYVAGSYEGLVPDIEFLFDIDTSHTNGQNLTTRTNTPAYTITGAGGTEYQDFCNPDTITIVLDSLSEVAGVWAGTFTATDVVTFSIEVYDTTNSVVLACADTIPFDSDMSASGNWLNFVSPAGLVVADFSAYTVAGSTITDTGQTLFSFDFQAFTANALGALAYTDNIKITVTASMSSAVMAMDETLFSFDANYSTTGTSELVTLPISGTYELQIDWGDGSVTRGTSAINTHTYADINNYDIKILGACAGFGFNNGGDKLKINSIAQWGELGLTSAASMLYGCSNLATIPTGSITGIATGGAVINLFRGCSSLVSIPQYAFDNFTTQTDFSDILNGCSILTTLPTGVFDLCTAAVLFNGSISNCTSITTLPSGLFTQNIAAQQFIFCCLNCTSLTAMGTGMFSGTGAVLLFNGCFINCTSLTGITSGAFDDCILTEDFTRTFEGCTGITAIPTNLFLLNIEIQTFDRTFKNCTGITSASGEPWLLSGITGYNLTSPLYDESTPNMSNTFEGAVNVSDYATIPAICK